MSKDAACNCVTYKVSVLIFRERLDNTRFCKITED
jgi:hypothetical protein